MQVQPLLNFDGRCEEALDHYTEALGAKVTGMMRWKDCPDKTSHATPGNEEKILNAAFNIGKTMLMAMDGPDPSGKPQFGLFPPSKITAARHEPPVGARMVQITGRSSDPQARRRSHVRVISISCCE